MSPPNDRSDSSAGPQTDPRKIGPYKILEPIGEGGMGIVYLAEQEEPVRRKVALKVIKEGMDTRQVVARFEAERQALAVMDHTNIAKVFDGGATESGRPYFVMEYVPGVEITEYCDLYKLSLRDRLELVIAVCRAVQHAHQKGVIHRDLKPSNILVSDQDGKAVPKIIDFGIAKATGIRLTEKTLHTQRGLMIGTPAYMSPEQAEMTGLDVDTRTDVYSLGVILYELLTGELPFLASDLEGFAALATLRDSEPPTPSSRFGSLGNRRRRIAEYRATDPRSLVRHLKGDLDWITMKAMEKDRSRRYETASAMALDIDRYLNGQTVLARAPSTGYRMKKFVRRHTASVLFASLLLLLLIGFAATMGVQAARIANERDRANKEAETARQVSDFMVGLFSVADPSEARGNTITVREILDKGAEEIEDELQDQPEVQGRLMDVMGRVYKGLGLYSQAGPLLEQATQIRRSALGDESVDLAESLQNLAEYMIGSGDPNGALPLAQEALAIDEKILGPDDPRTGNAHRLLGFAYQWLGRYDEAQAHLDKALDIHERTLGSEHAQTAYTLYRLGWQYRLLGEYETARDYYERTIPISEKVHGLDSPHLASYLADLGVVYSDLGNDSAARYNYKRALAIRERALGPDHVHVAGILNNLGILEWQAGNLAEAEQYYERALQIQEKTFGLESPNLTDVLNNLGLLHQMKKEYAAALGRYERALSIEERALGPDHVELAGTLGNLGYLLRYIGDFDRARPLLERALAILESAQGPDHPDLIMPLTNLGFLFADLGDYERAQAHFERVLAVTEKVYGRDHARVAAPLGYMVDVLITREDYDAVAPLLERWRAISPGENEIRLQTAKLHLGRGDAVTADSLLSLWLEGLADRLGSESGEFAFHEARSRALLGDREGALGHLRTALDRGYADAWLVRNAELKSLRGDPRFEAIVEEVKDRTGITDLMR